VTPKRGKGFVLRRAGGVKKEREEAHEMGNVEGGAVAPPSKAYRRTGGGLSQLNHRRKVQKSDCRTLGVSKKRCSANDPKGLEDQDEKTPPLLKRKNKDTGPKEGKPRDGSKKTKHVPAEI